MSVQRKDKETTSLNHECLLGLNKMLNWQSGIKDEKTLYAQHHECKNSDTSSRGVKCNKNTFYQYTNSKEKTKK